MSETVESWCRDYIRTQVLEHKLAPPAPPRLWEEAPEPLRLTQPGRPPELTVEERTRRSFPAGKLREPRWRAMLLHRFLHHELQAAELMAWAILAFPETDQSFRKGLLGIALDEIRHMGLYRERLAALGYEFGSFAVRDWFWERVPQCLEPLHFVALMGMGLEGANLDHATHWAAALRTAGDEESARCQETIGDEEVAHVRFALRWFEQWTGGVSFERWRDSLLAPLTPKMFRGRQANEPARLRAGFPPEFLQAMQDPTS